MIPMGRPQSKGRRRRSDRVRGPKIEGTDPSAISGKVGTNQQGISNPETGRINNGNDLPFHTLDIHLGDPSVALGDGPLDDDGQALDEPPF